MNDDQGKLLFLSQASATRRSTRTRTKFHGLKIPPRVHVQNLTPNELWKNRLEKIYKMSIFWFLGFNIYHSRGVAK